MAQRKFERDPGLLEREETVFKKPDMYRVVLLNDDYTPQDFVVEVLVGIFGKNTMEATEIMMNVHRKGAGTAGVYPYDLAQTKAAQAETAAGDSGYPLACRVEKDGK